MRCKVSRDPGRNEYDTQYSQCILFFKFSVYMRIIKFQIYKIYVLFAFALIISSLYLFYGRTWSLKSLLVWLLVFKKNGIFESQQNVNEICDGNGLNNIQTVDSLRSYTVDHVRVRSCWQFTAFEGFRCYCISYLTHQYRITRLAIQLGQFIETVPWKVKYYSQKSNIKEEKPNDAID